MRFIQVVMVAVLSLTSTLSMAMTPAENLSRLLQPLKTFSADFEQLILDNNKTRLQTTQGHVDLMKPGQFRWETLDPFPQLIVSNGKTLWLYDEDLEQVTQQKVDPRASHTPALLLSGEQQQIEESFTVAGPSSGDEGLFRLTPKDPDSLYVSMRILFVQGIPVEMQLEDNLGQQTSLQFQDPKANPTLNASLFQFEIPPGVDLIVE